MKRGIHYFKFFFLILILMYGVTACMYNSNRQSVSKVQTSQENNSTTSSIISNKQIVEAILIDIHEIPAQGNHSLDVYMESAEKLSGKLFGNITSEEDAKEKAITAWIEMGEMIKPPEQPINAKLYEKYNAWLIWENSLNSTYTNSDVFVYPPTPSTVLYIIIRKSDGKVLAVWPA